MFLYRFYQIIEMKRRDTAKSKIFSTIEKLFLIFEYPETKTIELEKIFDELRPEFEVDHMFLFENSRNQVSQSLSTFYIQRLDEFHNKEHENQDITSLLTELISYWKVDLSTGKEINQTTSQTSSNDLKRSLFDQNITSYLLIPIIWNKKLLGIIGFNRCGSDKIFKQRKVKMGRILAKAFGNMMVAERAYKKNLKNKGKYMQTISNIPDVVFKLNENLEITYLNDAWSIISDRAIHECLGHPLTLFLEWEGAEKLKHKIENLESSGKESCSLKTAFIKSDGSLYYIRIKVKLSSYKGKTEYFGTINDIHQDHLYSLTLKEGGALSKPLFETIGDIRYSLDPETGSILTISDQIERLGFKKEQWLMNADFRTDLIVLEDQNTVIKALDEFAVNKLPFFEIVYRVQTPSGKIIWMYDRLRKEYDSKNKAVRIHGRMSDITEQKIKEIQIEQSENPFSLSIVNLPFPYFISSDEDFKLIYFNFSFHEKFHPRSGKHLAIGNNWIEHFVQVDHQEDVAKFLKMNSNFSNKEIPLHTKEGIQWYNISSHSLPRKTGTLRAIVFHNLKKHKLGELELTKMNELFQTYNKTQGNFSKDSENEELVYRLLESMIRFTGSSFGFIGEVRYDEKNLSCLKSNVIKSSSLKETADPHDQRNYRLGLKFPHLDSFFDCIVVNKKVVISNEVYKDPRSKPNSTQEGQPQIQRFLGIPIFKGDQVVGIIGMANKRKPYIQRDVDFIKPFSSLFGNLIAPIHVNKEKDQEEPIKKESENFYELLAENIENIVTLHDLEMKTIYASPSLEKVTGFKPEHLIGKNLFDFFNLKQNDETDFSKVHQFILPIQHGITRKEIKLEVTWKHTYTQNGELSSFIASSKDVTDRELAKTELMGTLEKEEELEKLKLKFISMTSHELRTPLATIQSSADLIEILCNETLPLEKKEAILKQTKKITEQLRNLSGIVSTTSFFEPSQKKISSGKHETLTIKDFLNEIINSLNQPSETIRNVNVEIMEENLNITTNKYHLTTILKNLIENAVKFTQNSDQDPTLQVFKKKNQTIFSLKDSGIGIPRQEIEQVFEPFFRASNVGNIKGTGLGLSIVKDLVREINGEIKIKSKEKKGTEVQLILYMPK
jgi:PAS domain S-box-containing protein